MYINLSYRDSQLYLKMYLSRVLSFCLQRQKIRKILIIQEHYKISFFTFLKEGKADFYINERQIFMTKSKKHVTEGCTFGITE